MTKYKNRYGDDYTFTELENSNILWEGDFKYCRFGYPNDYRRAFSQYKNDGGELPFKKFKEEVHRFIYDDDDNYVGPCQIAQGYGGLVKTNTDVINMVDPSGGPYITEGTDLGLFGFPGKIVKEFKNRGDNWEIVVSL